MKNRKLYWLIFIMPLSATLSACTSPIGDFGRLNSAQLTQITQPQLQVIDKKSNTTYFNPLHYSTTEKKFRLTAHLLNQIPYDISIADNLRIVYNSKFPANTTPIDAQALLNSFNNSSIDNMADRNKSLLNDLVKRADTLYKFHELAQKTIAEDFKRTMSNSTTSQNYKTAIDNRRAQNKAQISDIVFYMKKLHISYNFIVDQGRVVEPNININVIKLRLSSFAKQIKRLETLL